MRRARFVEDRNVVLQLGGDPRAVSRVKLEAIPTGLLRLPAHLAVVVLDELAEAEHRGRAIYVKMALFAKQRHYDVRDLVQRGRPKDRLERERSDRLRAADL